MHDDRVVWLFRRLGAAQRTHLQALTSVLDAALETDLGMCQPLQRGTQTCGVHKGEHRVQALVRRTDQKAGGAVDVHDAGRVTVDAHLVFKRYAVYTVALALLSFGVWQVLWTANKGDDIGPRRSPTEQK